MSVIGLKRPPVAKVVSAKGILPAQPARIGQGRAAACRSQGLVAERRSWGLGVKVGLCISCGLLAAVATCASAIGSRPVRSGGVWRGIAFSSAAQSTRGATPLWSLIDQGPNGDRGASDSASESGDGPREKRDASLESASGRAGGRGVETLQPRIGAAEETPAFAGAKGASFGSPARGSGARTGGGRLASADSERGASRLAGVKRRTIVDMESEEQKVARAAAPKARIKVKDPVPVVSPQPPYPPAALAAQKEGIVRVNLLVSSAGIVDKVEIVDSQPEGVFDPSVRETLQQWRFSPARDQDGKPMDSWEMGLYEFSFQMRGARS